MTQKKDSELYEVRDIQARPLLIFLSGLTIMCICVFMATRSMQNSYTSSLLEERGADHPMATQRTVPSGPLLQAHPTHQIELLRQKENRALDSFGWVDAQEGIVRMPIESAKQVFLKRQATAKDEAGG